MNWSQNIIITILFMVCPETAMFGAIYIEAHLGRFKNVLLLGVADLVSFRLGLGSFVQVCLRSQHLELLHEMFRLIDQVRLVHWVEEPLLEPAFQLRFVDLGHHRHRLRVIHSHRHIIHVVERLGVARVLVLNGLFTVCKQVVACFVVFQFQLQILDDLIGLFALIRLVF